VQVQHFPRKKNETTLDEEGHPNDHSHSVGTFGPL